MDRSNVVISVWFVIVAACCVFWVVFYPGFCLTIVFGGSCLSYYCVWRVLTVLLLCLAGPVCLTVVFGWSYLSYYCVWWVLPVLLFCLVGPACLTIVFGRSCLSYYCVWWVLPVLILCLVGPACLTIVFGGSCLSYYCVWWVLSVLLLCLVGPVWHCDHFLGKRELLASFSLVYNMYRIYRMYSDRQTWANSVDPRGASSGSTLLPIQQFLARLFSKKTRRYCHSSGVVCVCVCVCIVVIVVVQKLAFCNISVITEGIYLKLGLVVHYEKGELIPIEEVTLKIFLAQLCPFFDLEFLLKNGFTAISQELMDEFWSCLVFSIIGRVSIADRNSVTLT